MQVRLVGERAVLVECAGHDEVAATYAMVLGRQAEFGAVDIVPAARTVLLDGLADAAGVLAALVAEPAPATTAAPVGREVVLPVSYRGEDLDEVARQWDVSTAEVVARHTSVAFTVAFCGFAPGFAYCTGLDHPVRRRPDPRPSVPPGSVALAGEYTGVYPTASPGGWQLIGRTAVELWRPQHEQPALLVPGTRVRFVDER